MKIYKKEETFQSALTVLELTRTAFPYGEFDGKTRKHKTKNALKLVKPSSLMVRADEENIADSDSSG